jgi:hypothetical protein
VLHEARLFFFDSSLLDGCLMRVAATMVPALASSRTSGRKTIESEEGVPDDHTQDADTHAGGDTNEDRQKNVGNNISEEHVPAVMFVVVPERLLVTVWLLVAVVTVMAIVMATVLSSMMARSAVHAVVRRLRSLRHTRLTPHLCHLPRDESLPFAQHRGTFLLFICRRWWHGVRLRNLNAPNGEMVSKFDQPDVHAGDIIHPRVVHHHNRQLSLDQLQLLIFRVRDCWEHIHPKCKRLEVFLSLSSVSHRGLGHVEYQGGGERGLVGSLEGIQLEAIEEQGIVIGGVVNGEKKLEVTGHVGRRADLSCGRPDVDWASWAVQVDQQSLARQRLLEREAIHDVRVGFGYLGNDHEGSRDRNGKPGKGGSVFQLHISSIFGLRFDCEYGRNNITANFGID